VNEIGVRPSIAIGLGATKIVPKQENA